MTTILFIFLGCALILQLFLVTCLLVQLHRGAEIDRWSAGLASRRNKSNQHNK